MNRKNKIKKATKFITEKRRPGEMNQKFTLLEKKERESFNLCKDKKIKIYKIVTFKQKTFN